MHSVDGEMSLFLVYLYLYWKVKYKVHVHEKEKYLLQILSSGRHNISTPFTSVDNHNKQFILKSKPNVTHILADCDCDV